MTTEANPDPIIAQWSETLEAELTEAGMKQGEAHAYRQSFELGLNRLMSVVATKQEFRDGLTDLRDQLQREMELRFAEVNRRFDETQVEFNRRFDEMQAVSDGRFDETRAESNRRFEETQRRTDQRFAEYEKLMMTKFDELDKRIRLLAAATGIGFTMVIGFLSALIVLVA